MTLHFKYILLFCCIVLLHGKKKEKRDLSDLKDDPILSSLFESDVKETRKDRSTTFKDELLAAQKDKSKHDQLNSILFPNKLEQRRETDPLSELMNMNKQTPESYLWSLNSNKDISNDNGNTNERLKEVAKQLASGQTNGNNMETLQSAVNPALFQSNYVPLPGEGIPPQIVPEARRSYIPMYPIFNQYLWQRNDYPDVRQFMTNNARSYIPITPYTINTRLKDIPQDIPHFTIVSKKNTIPQVRPASMQSQEVSKSKQQKNIEYKKSLIPLPLNPSITNSAPSKTSYPVQLRVNSPNEKLRGIVPHVPEYGETVESIRRVQQALNYRKSFIPQQPQIAPNPTINPKSKKSAIPKKTAHNKKQQSSKKSKTPQNKGKISGGKTGTKEQRQFIPSPPVQQFVTQQQYIPSYIANYQQQSPFSMQQSVVQPYIAPPNAAQVQNMDGLHTRPIITAEECADQYATCGDFAKNNYCTDYPELMKIQCRKSCGHCVPSQTQSPVNQPATQQQQVAPAAAQTAQQLAPIAAPAVTVQNETAVKGGETKALLNTTSQSDDSVGSGEADAGSGSGGDNPNEQTAPSSLKRSKEVSSALEGSESGSGRIADTDAESGAESGSAMSESSRFEGTPSTENAKKMPELNGAKRSKIEKPKIITKIVPKAGFGEFSLPTKKSVIPTLTNQINDDDDSGSGSGSGTESGDESGAESGDTGAEKKSVTPASQVIPVHAKPTQKKSIPKKPSLPGAYPKIDLRAIASALAHYEEAALELAGEYPKPGSVDLTEYTRSFIPHPVDKAQENLNKYKQNLQVAKILTDERAKKADVPKYLKLSKDAYRKDETDEKPSTDADNLDSVRQRFIIPGVEPTLNDYYAETGKMNPFQKKHTNSKKSKIEASTIAQDPYEYIRNMPSGASMEPIVDPKARSTIPSDHSYPIFLMKVSPGEKKYVEEPATRRGKIRKLNAEGLPIFEDEKKPVAVPNPPPAPQHNFAAPKVETVPAPAQPSNYFMHPQSPLFMQVAPPPPRPAQETVAFQPSWENNVEQITAPNPSALFAHEEPVQPEKQPGTNFLRSKMLNAFFSMKNNDAAEDEGSGGGGSGDGVRRGQIHEQIEGSGGGETGTKKTISLHNLLFNENGDESKEISVASGKTANQRKVQQDPSATYLQSNLAALTPENGNPNFEVQSGLTSGRLGAQFTMNKMSKTQETNWVRPNAESELASAMPESSSTAVETSRGVPQAEASTLLSSLRSSNFIEDQRPALRNVVPRAPLIKKKLLQAVGSSKAIIPSHIFTEQPQIRQQQQYQRLDAIQKPIHTDTNLLREKINSNNFVNLVTEKLSAPQLALASLQEKSAKTLLTEFPRSPFSTVKSTIPFSDNIAQANVNRYSTLLGRTWNDNLIAKKNFLDNLKNKQNMYSWRQYVPFPHTPRQQLFDRQKIAMARNNPINTNVVDNEQKSLLSAKAGAAQYAVSNMPGVNTVSSSVGNLVNKQENNGQYAGWNYLISSGNSIHPLSYVQKTENPVRKNLIKQKPDLDCGENWEGAQGDFGTFCYKEMTMKASFDDALAECRRLKGDLFSVLNAYENRYLEDNIHEKFWIGYRDKGMDGNWSWTDGSNSIFTSWGKEIGNSDNKRHDCVFLDEEEGKWKDDSCLQKKPFLCKKKTDECPKTWKNLKLNTARGCYKLFDQPKDWEEAESACRIEGAHLASLTSEDEQTMVFQVHSSKSYWIGYNDQDSEGDWMWSDRSTSSYENWDEKSPNNGGVSCAAMTNGGKWNDEPCTEKLRFVCKRKGPKPEKVDGLDNSGILLPIARLLNNKDTAPSHMYDDLSKNGPRPVVPIYFWPLLKTTKPGMTGNRPMVVHGDVHNIPDGISLDGVRSYLDAGDFHGKCITDPDKCQKGFAVALQIFLENAVSGYKKAHCIIDTSGGGDGFTISISNDKLNYRVVAGEEVWELKSDFVVGIWQDIVMTWHRGKGIFVYVNGAFKDSESVSKKITDRSNDGTTRLTIGRENKEKGPYACARMVLASVAIFTKFLSIEDVPYVFTYGDTVVATYRWLMTGMKDSLIPEAPSVEIKQSATDVDGGIYIDGEKGWLEIDNLDSVVYNIGKAKHGFSISFKVKFDQRVRDYKEERYILDSGGHTGGLEGVSVYIVNDNLYFQVISNTQEDLMIWKVRVPIYTVRWQRVVMTWRLDKGLWVYVDGIFRGYTKIPAMFPEQTKSVPKQFLIGRRNTMNKNAGAQFAFGSLAIFNRYLSRHETENIFGGIDNPFPGIIREVWKNTPGDSLSGLKANPDYPNNPSTIEIIENFDAPFNVESNYGSKLKGYFIAPETGNSTFYLSCSKQCQLYFSGDEESKNKEEIISLTQSTWHNQWNKYKNQSSKEIFLVAGKYYYLEAIHKGVDASDSLSVGVRMPTGRYQRPIIKENLQWRLPGNQHAGLIREVWYDVPGYTISDLTSNANFPNRPSSTEVLDKFDAPFNYADNYGSRISGYFHAPETGDYRFYLSTDSSGELWISSDESQSNLVKVVTLNGWTDHNQWLKFNDQKSDKVFLAAGRYYFMRVYMKAEKLGDCASVAVEFPSGHFEGPIKKKHLSWKIVGVNDGPGPKEIIEPTPKPVGLFQLNDASVKDILLPGNNKLELGDVDLTTGPGGLKDDAFMFKGNKSSYIEIPNDGRLDTKKSITLLASIFPLGSDGPIINYKKDGWGVHLWQFNRNQLFARFVTKDGQMSTQPLGAKVIEMNKWNQVGASYDHKSGVAQLWHDGKMVKSRNIGRVELLTNASIRLGAREGDDRYYKGKISCVIIFDKALKEEQVGELRHCPKSKSKQQSSIENDELTVFAQGSGMAPDSEEFDTVENRIGDDTEEELTAHGEKNKATKCDPNPCKNNGICQDDDKKIDGFVCRCADDFTGKHCQVSKPEAENPIVKRTEIPKTYEKKEDTAAYTKTNSTDSKNGIKNPDESKEDISLLYQKLGCYKDDSTYRDLKTKVNLKKTSQEECAKACALEDKSFSYFGLQNGTSCYCGKSYGKYGKLLDEECSLKCEGNNEESCGGEQANDVFFFGLGTNYTVKTFTGRKPGAGTDAKIYLEFIGERGSSDFRQLDSRIEKYEPGSVEQQTFLLPDLGKLKRMKILHDNTGTAPSWYLEKVQVTDEEGSSYEFPCNDWLSDTQSGGKLERELQGRSIVTLPT